MSPLQRLVLEMGPLLLFVLAHATMGLFVAVLIFVGALAASLLVSWRLERRFVKAPVVGAAFVLIFGVGSLTSEPDDAVHLNLSTVDLLLLIAVSAFAAFWYRNRWRL